MRFFPAVIFLLSIGSCGPKAALVTDDMFRTAAPEVVRAWEGLGPFKEVRTVTVPRGAGFPGVEAAVRAQGPGVAFLVGADLSSAERQSLVKAFPGANLTFFMAPVPENNLKALSLDPMEARRAVASAAAANSKGRAAALYDPGTPPADTDRFKVLWAVLGGGPLETVVGPRTTPWPKDLTQVFVWTKDPADQPVPDLPPSVSVHGNPGQVRPPGASGFEWTIKKDGLGDFLWATALNSRKQTYFIPLETVFIRR